MKKQRLTVLLAFSLLLVVATVIGCGTLGVDGFLIPVGGGEEFAFVVGGQNDCNCDFSIGVYSVDPDTGKLTPSPGSPFSTGFSGGGTSFIDVDPNSKFVFVPQGTQGGVAVYSVGSNGDLTAVAGSPFVLGVADAPFSAKLDPTGKFLYVTDRANGEIYAASVGSDGKLTLIGAGGLDLPGFPYQIIMDPQGRFLYVSVCIEGEGCESAIDGFKIDATTGALTAMPGNPSFITGNGGRSGTIDSTGKFLLLAEVDDDDVRVYSIDQATGALTQVGNPVPSDSGAFHVVEAKVGGTTYMAVNNYYAGNITVFTFDAGSGTLAPISGNPFAVANDPHFAAVDPSGRFGYIASAESAIVGFTLNTNGTPTEIPGSPFSTQVPDHPNQIVITKK